MALLHGDILTDNEIEFDIPTALETVGPEHPNLLATAYGPLVLLSVSNVPSSLTRRELTAAAASQAATGSTDWQAKSAAGTLRLRPFAAIRDEHYRLYLKLDA